MLSNVSIKIDELLKLIKEESMTSKENRSVYIGCINIRQVWINTYIIENHSDPHTIFSERIMQPKHIAKQLAYKEAWNTTFLKDVFNNISHA